MKKQLKTPIPLSIINEVNISNEFDFLLKRYDKLIERLSLYDQYIFLKDIDIRKKRLYYQNLDELTQFGKTLRHYFDRLEFRYKREDF